MKNLERIPAFSIPIPIPIPTPATELLSVLSSYTFFYFFGMKYRPFMTQANYMPKPGG